MFVTLTTKENEPTRFELYLDKFTGDARPGLVCNMASHDADELALAIGEYLAEMPPARWEGGYQFSSTIDFPDEYGVTFDVHAAIARGFEIARIATTAHIVLYRTGGTARFQWRRVLNRLSVGAAKREAESIRRMGYRALVVTEAEFEKLGLPTTWEADEYFAPGCILDISYEE